eukprot:gb/GFBE01017701.1/.p1 GENE.gb/GFBE01017701.1/~~gb/GFBE01017701.1/.p1  ORF type:complete len:1000 (+),score=194.91 gb/GFBE01017701.1/:1-3000(+)
MVVMEAIGLASKEIFDYNRENYKFDQEQRLEKDMQRVEMQIKRFDLFREDIEDLVKLTVDKMDMYHIVGALFLSFTALVYCEGTVEGPQPPFFMGQYLLTVAASFVYLLLAVWLSMYASIASHSFGVRLRTRYVRLPIPNLNQIQSLTTTLADFEKQGVSKVMRLPFGPQGAQNWQLRAQRQEAASSSDQAAPAPAPEPDDRGHTALPETHLGGQGDVGFGREDVLMKAAASVPGKHVELFRKLQAKWQCYDAYARIAMALGVNQMIQSVNYFVVGMTMIQRCSPSCGFAATIIFQACTFGLMFLDIAGLDSWKIKLLGLTNSLPMIIVVAMLAVANLNRGAKEPVDLISRAFYAAPACAYIEAIFLELFMRVARPSKDEAALPRRFRAVLFLDVFGDAAYDPTEAEHAVVTAGVDGKFDEEEDQAAKREVLQTQAARAEAPLATAHAALRRWEAVPQELLSEPQVSQLEFLRQELGIWRGAFHGCNAKMKSRRGVPYDSARLDARALRAWGQLSAQEQAEDTFAETLLGPLQRRADGTEQFYSLELGQTVWELNPSISVLKLEEVTSRVKEAEEAVRILLQTEKTGLATAAGSVQEEQQDGGEGSGSFIDAAGFRRKKRGTGHLRLPWKSVRRMTGVLQICWIFLGSQRLLASLKLWATNWEISIGSFRRLSDGDSQVWPGQFESVSVSWPHGAFFRPSTLSCSGETWSNNSATDGSFVLGSRFLQYRAEAAEAAASELKLVPLPSGAFPVDAVSLHCWAADAPLGHAPCLAAQLQQGGRELALWIMPGSQQQPLGSRLQEQPAVAVLQIEGQPWSKLAGAAVPCPAVRHLSAVALQAGEDPGWCLLLAGWDGQRIPLAAVQLPKDLVNLSSAVPSAGLVVSPRVDAPLRSRQRSEQEGVACPDVLQDVLALHLTPHESGGRLWALLPDGHVQAWEVSTLRTVGQWFLSWTGASTGTDKGNDFEALAICETSGRSLLLAGLDQARRPQLLRTELPQWL